MFIKKNRNNKFTPFVHFVCDFETGINDEGMPFISQIGMKKIFKNKENVFNKYINFNDW